MKFFVTSETGKLRFRSTTSTDTPDRYVNWTFDTLEELMSFIERAHAKYNCGVMIEWGDPKHHLTILDEHNKEPEFYHD